MKRLDENQFSLFDKKKRETGVEITKIPLSWINVLTQPRQTFDEIEELAGNIAAHGLFNPVGVAEFNGIEIEEYLETINSIWKTDFQKKNLFSPNTQDFYILIDGERRTQAMKLIQKVGCVECIEKFGIEKPGVCFNRHFPNGTPVSLIIGYSPEKILKRQFSENIHRPVPPAEEAEAYRNLFCFLKKRNKNYTITEFAHEMGRSSQSISQALAFCELPVLIQETAKKPPKDGGIPYGIALQLTRLQKAGISEEDLIWWGTRAMVGGYKLKKMKQLVSTRIIEINSGQKSLFKIMGTEQEKVQKKALIKRTVEKEIIVEIWSYISYFRRVLGLFENGNLGLETSPFSETSPRRVYQELIKLMHDQLFGHMEKILGKNSETTERILCQARDMVEKFEK